MELTTMKQSEYREIFGPIGSRTNEETLELWRKLQALPIVEYIVVEPGKGEKLDNLRSSLYASLRKMALKLNAKFVPRFAMNKSEGHILIWKEAKPGV